MRPNAAATAPIHANTPAAGASAPSARSEILEPTPSAAVQHSAPTPTEPQMRSPQLQHAHAKALALLPDRYAAGPKSLKGLSLDPGRPLTPSPAHWSDRSFYFVMTDRFADGDKSNNTLGWAGYDPADPKKAHGGDLKGLINHLDYIKKLGCDTLWITPVVQNYDAYHGYAAINFLGVDPRLGTAADYRKLVDEAHKRGMYVIFDMVANHSADVLDYPKGFHGFSPTPVKGTKFDPTVPALRPTELYHLKDFHRQGTIQNWYDKEQYRNGDFPSVSKNGALSSQGLSDFNTQDPSVDADLIKIYEWWIAKFDVDGFRIDTVKHVNPGFWAKFVPQIRAFARSVGKKNFLLMPEIFEGDHATQATYTERPAPGGTFFNGPLNHPFYFSLIKVFQGQATTSALGDQLRSQIKDFHDPNTLGNFIDNHDLPRFLHTVGGNRQALECALALLYGMPGMPILYYGTEQGFSGGGDPDNREDMFKNPALTYSTVPNPGQSHFDTHSDLYKAVQKLNALRRAIPALRRGKTEVRWEKWHQPGLFAFARKLPGQEVIVAINPYNQNNSADNLHVDPTLFKPGDTLVDRLHPGRTIKVVGTAQEPHLDFTMGPYDRMILTKQGT